MSVRISDLEIKLKEYREKYGDIRLAYVHPVGAALVDELSDYQLEVDVGAHVYEEIAVVSSGYWQRVRFKEGQRPTSIEDVLVTNLGNI